LPNVFANSEKVGKPLFLKNQPRVQDAYSNAVFGLPTANRDRVLTLAQAEDQGAALP
jgi:hypothetical protein